MKKIVFACIAALISATAFAATAYMDTVSRQISWTRPDKAVHPETKQEFKNPSDGTLAACGIVQVEYEDCDFKYRLWGWEPSPWCRAMNAAERQAVDDAEAQAQAEAAAMAGPDPELFVPALDENGNKVGTARIVVRAATWELVPLTNEASPKRVWLVQRDEYKSRIARSDALKNRIKGEKAKGNGNAALIGRVSALEAKEGVE